MRHIEFVPLTDTRILSVLITDSGRVEQRVIDLPRAIDEQVLGEVRARLNVAVVGLSMSAAAKALTGASGLGSSGLQDVVDVITATLSDQVGPHLQDKLVMAGTANLVRTEEDFTGSIYPVLEAIEEQVVLLRREAERTSNKRIETDTQP